MLEGGGAARGRRRPATLTSDRRQGDPVTGSLMDDAFEHHVYATVHPTKR
jgi:hypothetical protein